VFFKNIITAITVFLAGLFGCSKSTAPVAATTSSAAVAQAKVKNLGVVPLTNHYETCLSFGAGKDCRIVPKVLDRNNVQLTLTLESKKPNGQISGLSVVQMVGDPRKPFEISIGGTDFTFTPQITAE
jgi:hypothetical protein